jgi:hypothetical protein
LLPSWLARARGEQPPGAGEVAQEVDHHALELGEGLLVEGEGVDGGGVDAGELQAGEGGGDRQAGVVLDPRQPLLLDRGDHNTVDDERGRGVVVMRGDAEDAGHIVSIRGGSLPGRGQPAAADRPREADQQRQRGGQHVEQQGGDQIDALGEEAAGA